MTTTVADVMTTEVAAVPETAGYKEIAALLRRHGVSVLPVLGLDRRVIGVVSEADVLDLHASRELPNGAIRLAWQLRQWSRASKATAADLMTAPAVTISPDASVAEAARLLQGRRLTRLPVTDPQGRLAGVISRADVLSTLERPDDLIRHQVITNVIAEGLKLNPHAFQVTVSAGLVTVAGPVGSRSAAIRLIGAIWQVDGVCGVRDRLCYPKEEQLGSLMRPPRRLHQMGIAWSAEAADWRTTGERRERQ
jgi:CBS domain-containing protein